MKEGLCVRREEKMINNVGEKKLCIEERKNEILF
jgi:hypothetical protein